MYTPCTERDFKDRDTDAVGAHRGESMGGRSIVWIGFTEEVTFVLT